MTTGEIPLGKRIESVELPKSLADDPTQARPFDQARWLGEPPWRDDELIEQWEAAHGHDVRIKCYVEFGCQAVMYESDARERRIEELESELRRVKHGYGYEAMETEAVLAQALGYTYDEQYGWVTGDHTITTLAVQARTRINELRRQLTEQRLRFEEELRRQRGQGGPGVF